MEQPSESLDSGAEVTADEITQPADNSTSPDDPIESDSPSESLLDTPDDDEEVDYDGEKYKVPKKLKDAFLRQQDYTQKTQQVAEQRKAVEAQAAEIQRNAQAQQQNIAEYAEAYSLDNQLKQFGQIKWSELIDADPVQAMKLQHQMNELKQRRDQVVASVTQKQQAQALESQRETAKRLQEGRAVLEREIQGWQAGNEIDNALGNYGKDAGIPELSSLVAMVPKIGVVLHKAYQFDQLMKKQAAQKEKPAVQEKPITRISAVKGTATKDPSKMTDKEFAQWRSRQIAQR